MGAVVLLALVLLLPPALRAQSTSEAASTKITVRVHSNDAKLLQDPVGGARVTIRETASGEVLAQGRVEGGSGSTERIVRTPRERGASIYDTPGAAVFLTTLDLEQPTQVEITAEGPLDYPQAMQRATKTMWLMPGEDLVGDGVVLTLHGFIVEVLEPASIEAATPGEDTPVRARVRMLCGCPTEPGGLWDADRYTIRAALLRNGEVVAEQPLSFAGEASLYEGTIRIPEEGATALRVTAADAERVNVGVATLPASGVE